jgi:hypothetical protein
MQAIKVETTVEKEGELHLTNLPIYPNQRVEVIVLVPDEKTSEFSPSPQQENEGELQRLMETIRHSEPPFPTLDEAMKVSRSCL